MTDTKFLCAVDLADSQLLSMRSPEMWISGWIISTHAGTRIREVTVECNGKRHNADFPQARTDVKTYYPDLENSQDSGFLTPRIPLDPGTDRALDIRVMAKYDGCEHPVFSKQVRLVWFDPKNELFRLGQVAPFKFPESFDPAQLKSYSGCSPLFLLGREVDIAPIAQSLQQRVAAVRQGAVFLELLKALVECHDVYVDYWKTYFAHVEKHIQHYAVGRCDIAEVLNSVIASVHEHVVADPDGESTVITLTGKQELILVPLLERIYPEGRFVQLRPNLIFRAFDPIVSWCAALPRRLLASRDEKE